MTFDMGTVNWIAVIVAALLYFLLGALWYSKLAFARPWQEAIGWDESRTDEANPITYLVPALLYVVAGVAMAVLVALTGADDFSDGITLGLLTGIGFALPMVGVEATFDPNKPKRLTWFAITVAYHLIGFLILGVVIAAWR